VGPLHDRHAPGAVLPREEQGRKEGPRAALVV